MNNRLLQRDPLYLMDLYIECLELWAQNYVDGIWTLEQFESHADQTRRGMFGS